MPASIAAQTLDLVRQLLDGQQETNRQLVIMNGRTKHLEEREKAHSSHLGNLDAQVADLRAKQEAAAVHDEYHSKQLATSESRLWSVALKVAEIGAGAAAGGGIVAVVMKALEK